MVESFLLLGHFPFVLFLDWFRNLQRQKVIYVRVRLTKQIKPNDMVLSKIKNQWRRFQKPCLSLVKRWKSRQKKKREEHEDIIKAEFLLKMKKSLSDVVGQGLGKWIRSIFLAILVECFDNIQGFKTNKYFCMTIWKTPIPRSYCKYKFDSNLSIIFLRFSEANLLLHSISSKKKC